MLIFRYIKNQLLNFVKFLSYKRLIFYNFLFNLKYIKIIKNKIKINFYFILRFLLLILVLFVFLLKFEFQYLLLLFLGSLIILFIEYSYNVNKIDLNSYILYVLSIVSCLIVLIFFFDILVDTWNMI